MAKAEKKKAATAAETSLDDVIGALTGKFGAGSCFVAGSAGGEARMDIDAVSTYSLGLDAATGIGGLPLGRMVEIFGPPSAGKTTLTLHIIAQAQKRGLTCAFVDVEHALDPHYAQELGVDLSKLLVSQPDYGEQAIEVVDTLCSSGKVKVIVVDSVAALTPKAEIEGEVDANHVGRQSRMMSGACRRLVHTTAKHGVLLIWINQIRMKIGVLYGSPETTTGGEALKFYTSIRLEVRRAKAIQDGEDIVGNRTRVKVVKNKLAPPFKEAEFDIDFGEGISRVGEIVDIGVATGVIDKAGAWLSYKGERIGQGRDNAKSFLIANPDLAEKIAGEVLAKCLNGSFGSAASASASTATTAPPAGGPGAGSADALTAPAPGPTLEE